MGIEVEESRMEAVALGASEEGNAQIVGRVQETKVQLDTEGADLDTPIEELKERVRRRRAVSEKAKRALIEAEMERAEALESGAQQRRKRRRKSTDQEDHVEAAIAAGMGFPQDFLTEEEIRAGVVGALGGVEQANYIVIRNHILAKWRQNVDRWLPESAILDNIRAEHKSLVRAAYRFLSQAGYINFGVAPAIKERVRTGVPKATMIVIGAGLAGLAAARQLVAFGHKVIILEGRARPGGRVHTRQMDASGHSAAADLGGSVLTGTDGNPLGVLARQLKLPMHHIRSDPCPIYGLDGQRADEELDKRVEVDFNQLLDKAEETRKAIASVADSISLGSTLDTLRRTSKVAQSEEERQLLDWHMANLEYANAGLLHDLSLAFWDQDDPHDFSGDHCFLTGGNGRLVTALADGLPIFYGKTVRTIKYSDSGVRVHTADGQVFEGDMALSTIPLGCLKRGDVTFEPPLPKEKQAAIRRLGFGLLNKVALLFPYNFWGTDLDTFGRVAPDSQRRGEYFLFYSYEAVSGGHLLLALVAGEAAKRFEKVPSTEVIADVMSVLRSIYEQKGVTVPNPLSTLCTRWGSDPFAYGSYSHVAVGASGDDYDVMAESCGNGRLFFAGEATTRWHPATMHGAFLTGLREAGWMDATAVARAQGQPLPVQSAPSNLSVQAVTLAEVFKKPDMEFGGYSIVLDPRSSLPSSPVLLRLVLRSVQSLTKPMKWVQERDANGKSKGVKNGQQQRPALSPAVLALGAPQNSAGLQRFANGGHTKIPSHLSLKDLKPSDPVKGLKPPSLFGDLKWSLPLKDSKVSDPPSFREVKPQILNQPKAANFPVLEDLKPSIILQRPSQLPSLSNLPVQAFLSGSASPARSFQALDFAARQLGQMMQNESSGGLASTLGLGPQGPPLLKREQGHVHDSHDSRALDMLRLGKEGSNFVHRGWTGDTVLSQESRTLLEKSGPSTSGVMGKTCIKQEATKSVVVGSHVYSGLFSEGAGLAQVLNPVPSGQEASLGGHNQIDDRQLAGPNQNPFVLKGDSLEGLNEQTGKSDQMEEFRDLPDLNEPADVSRLSEVSGTPGKLDSTRGGENTLNEGPSTPERSKSLGEAVNKDTGRSEEAAIRSKNAGTHMGGSHRSEGVLLKRDGSEPIIGASLVDTRERQKDGTVLPLVDSDLKVVQAKTSDLVAPATTTLHQQVDPLRSAQQGSAQGSEDLPSANGTAEQVSLPSEASEDKSQEPLVDMKVQNRTPKAELANGKAKGAQTRGKKKRRGLHEGAFTPSQKELAVYTVLTRAQAEQLREVKGGDRARLQMLVDTFKVKLVGRQGLGAAGESLLASLRGPNVVAGGLLPRGKINGREQTSPKEAPNGTLPRVQRPRKPKLQERRQKETRSKQDRTENAGALQPKLQSAALPVLLPENTGATKDSGLHNVTVNIPVRM